jgi:hypothetical protein
MAAITKIEISSNGQTLKSSSYADTVQIWALSGLK